MSAARGDSVRRTAQRTAPFCPPACMHTMHGGVCVCVRGAREHACMRDTGRLSCWANLRGEGAQSGSSSPFVTPGGCSRLCSTPLQSGLLHCTDRRSASLMTGAKSASARKPHISVRHSTVPFSVLWASASVTSLTLGVGEHSCMRNKSGKMAGAWTSLNCSALAVAAASAALACCSCCLALSIAGRDAWFSSLSACRHIQGHLSNPRDPTPQNPRLTTQNSVSTICHNSCGTPFSHKLRKFRPVSNLKEGMKQMEPAYNCASCQVI